MPAGGTYSFLDRVKCGGSSLSGAAAPPVLGQKADASEFRGHMGPSELIETEPFAAHARQYVHPVAADPGDDTVMHRKVNFQGATESSQLSLIHERSRGRFSDASSSNAMECGLHTIGGHATYLPVCL